MLEFSFPDWIAGWELRDPWFLLAALLAPAVYYWARRVPSVVRISSTTLLGGLPRSLRQRLSLIPALLLALATVALATALAGPRRGDATTRIHREGIAILMLVDRSGSMWAYDFATKQNLRSRLDVVKDVFRSFVLGGEGRPGRVDDLVGLVGFGSFADSLCPLTLDHANLITILDQVEIAPPHESGTAIGDGLGLAVERLRKHPARSKVVVLLTDGENTAGELSPLQAASLAADHDVRVYTIGVGSQGPVPYPVLDARGEPTDRIRSALFPLDEKTLQQIARATGGQYYSARSASALEDVVEEIDTLERAEIFELRYLQYTEYYTLFACASLGLIGVAGIASATIFRRLP